MTMVGKQVRIIRHALFWNLNQCIQSMKPENRDIKLVVDSFINLYDYIDLNFPDKLHKTIV